MRRPFQFGLRLFLAVMVCIGVVIGLSIKAAVSVLTKNAAIDAIAAEEDACIFMFAADGSIEDSRDSDPQEIHFFTLKPDALARNLNRCSRIRSVVDLRLFGLVLEPERLLSVETNFSVEKISLYSCSGLSLETSRLLVQKFPRLREIDLEDSDIADDGLAALGRLDCLSKIDLTGISVPATNIAHICASFPTLKHLVIERADLSGELRYFCSLPCLETLVLNYGSFSGADLADFLDCTTCTKVEAFGVEERGVGLSEREVKSLVQDPDKLRILDWDPTN